MTYREAYEKAEWKLEKGEITCGEFDEMTKPLDEEIRPHGEWEGKPECKQLITRRCTACGERAVVATYCMWCGADTRKKGEQK